MKKYLVFILILLCIAVASILVYRSLYMTPKREYLLHDFHQHTTRIQTISLAQKDKQIEFVNEGGVWSVIEGSSRLEANVLKIYQLFNMLEGLTILEKKTDDITRFEKLGVDQAQALHLIMKDVDGQIVVDLMIGGLRRTSEKGVSDQALYIRRSDENQVWLVEGKLQLEMDVNLWKKVEIEENK